MTGMLFLMERHARKQATARAEKAETERELADTKRRLAEAERLLAEANDRIGVVEWLRSLTDEQREALYDGPVTIGGVAWTRIGGQDIIGRRTENGWIIEYFSGLLINGSSGGNADVGAGS